MSSTVSFAPHAGDQIALPVIVKQAFKLMLTRGARRQARNRLRWELSQCSDRALANRGLSRAGIEDVVQNRHRGA